MFLSPCIVSTEHVLYPFHLLTLPIVLLLLPYTNNFIPPFPHCSLPFYCLLTKQTPTLSMTVSQFKAAKGL